MNKSKISKHLLFLIVTVICISQFTKESEAHVLLVSPNGGEILAIDSVYVVKWTDIQQHDLVDYDLWFSVVGPSGPWVPIVLNLEVGDSALGTIYEYEWVVPDIESNDVYVRVRQDNDIDFDYEDSSDASLSIVQVDADSDGIADSVDNCTGIANPSQTDSDSDNIGDACDSCPLDKDNDIDGDSVCGDVDNCPTVSNSDQTDDDNDGYGAACDCNDADSLDIPQTWYLDSDGDGYGDPDVFAAVCSAPPDYVTDNSDCDDSDIELNPDTKWYLDSDGDGYGDSNVELTQCEKPVGYVRDNSDCDDTDAGINPELVWYEDTDGDGHGVPSPTTMSCEQPLGFASDSTDNCPTVSNPLQEDSDSDGIGDACCCVAIRGDANGDGVDANILDLNFLVNRVFRGGPSPGCPKEGDVNSDGAPANILDLNFMVNKVFRAGPLPGPC